jgi:hypothetical protein
MLAPYVLLLIRLEATLDSLPNIKRYAETMKVQPRLGAAVCYQPGVLTVLRISAAKVLCWALVSRTSQSGCQQALVRTRTSSVTNAWRVVVHAPCLVWVRSV